ncbi:hypothetical protein T01_4426, partial [Trichinella spiralis]
MNNTRRNAFGESDIYKKKQCNTGYKCYYDHEHCLEDISRNFCINIHKMELYSILSRARYHPTFLQYLSKYAFIQRATRRFWKVLRQINAYVSNKWLLKLLCAYLNTQESRHTGTPLKWNKDFVAIIMRYSFTFCTLVQYFLVLGNLIFLHFRSISNKLKK